MTPVPNPYEFLKIPCLEDVQPVEASSSWIITDSQSESITITNAVLPDGSWVYGYIVLWARGCTSVRQPTAELGKFRTRREARLHAVGFMKVYLDYFTESTRQAIAQAEKHLLQATLFND